MGKAKLIVILVVILSIGSGLVAGMLVTRLPSSGTAEAPQARSPLAEELQLTAEQNEKMRGIWEGVRGKVDECFVQAQAAQKRRDDALLALLSDEQKIKYAKVQQDCAQELSLLRADRDAAFGEAVKKTEQVLSEAQKKRYREILQSRLGQASAGVPDWIPEERKEATKRRSDEGGKKKVESRE